MDKETRKAIGELGFYSSLGMAVALSIFIGLFAGIYLDKKFGTHPWLTFIGLGFGIVAGYKQIAMAIEKTKKNQG